MLTYNGLTDSLIKAVKDVMEGEKKVHQHRAFGFTTEQKMDPVGKEDDDINNDGKVDKSDKYLHNRRKAISKSMGEKKSSSVVMNPVVKEDMSESKLTPAEKKKLDNLIYAYRDATDPFGSEYDIDPDDVIAKIRKQFGDKIADTVSRGASMHYPRPGHASGVYDPLSNKSSPRVSKSGKINKQDAETMKRSMKQRSPLKKPMLTKEDAQLDEADMTKISTERLREIIKSAENQRVSPGFGSKLIAAKQELKRRKNNASVEEMSSKEKMKRGLYNSQEQTQVSSGLENPHNCATHVYSEEWGDGRTITTMHADPDAEGNIAWYDVMFEHGIQKGVPIEELEVVLSESHMHSKRGKK
jgi:hypothetical protein